MIGFRPSIHGLRAVAALAVLLFHWYQIFPAASLAMGSAFPSNSIFNPTTYLAFGWLGVPLFFILSGYLLGSKVMSTPLSWRFLAGFWRRRFLRIYPAVWLHLAVLLVAASWVTGLVEPAMWDALGWQFALWINMPPNMQAPISNVMWTLPIELSFYLLLPFIGVLSRRMPWFVLLTMCLAITLLWRTWVMSYFEVAHYTAVLPWLDLLPGSLFTFMVGYSLNFLPSALPKQTVLWGVRVSVIAFLLMLQWQQWRGDVYWTGHWILIVWPACVAVTLGGLVYFGTRHGPSDRWLSRPGMIWLGNISFGIYLWHYPIMRGLFLLFPDQWKTVGMSVVALPIALLLTLPIASLSYRFVERPLMGWR